MITTTYTQLVCVVFGMLGSMVAIACFMLHSNITEENPCHMTYVYRHFEIRPIRFKVEEDCPSGKLYKYTLGLYNEGSQYIGKETLEPHEIPVLFLPGSGGSPVQVRSIAAVMQNKTEMAGVKWRYRFFTVDFAGQFSFSNGVVLESQMRYVHQVLRHIRKMTRGTKKTVIIGHSYGGTVAMSLVNHEDYHPDWVDLIILKAAPLNEAPVMFDYKTRWFFDEIRSSWAKKKQLYNNIGVVSFAGGLRDYLVPDQLAQLPMIYNRSLWSVEGVPDYGVDHLCIIWCNQFVRYLSRLLFKYGEEYDGAYLNGQHILDKFFAEENERMKKVALTEEMRTIAPVRMMLGKRYENFVLPENGKKMFRMFFERNQITFFNASSKGCVKKLIMYRKHDQRHIVNAEKGTASLLIYRVKPQEPVDVMVIGKRGCRFETSTTPLFYSALWKWYEVVFAESHYVLSTFIMSLIRMMVVEIDTDRSRLLSFGLITSSVVTGLVTYALTEWVDEQGAVIAGYVFAFGYWFVMSTSIETVSTMTKTDLTGLRLPSRVQDYTYMFIIAQCFFFPTVGVTCAILALAFRFSFPMSIMVIPICLPIIFRTFYTRIPFIQRWDELLDPLHIPVFISTLIYVAMYTTGSKFKRSPLFIFLFVTLPMEWIFRAIPLEVYSSLALIALTLFRFIDHDTGKRKKQRDKKH